MLVTVVTVVWVIDFTSTLLYQRPTNPYVQTAFAAVLTWALGMEIAGAVRRDDDDPQP